MQRTNGTDKTTHLHSFQEKERSGIRNREFQGHNADRCDLKNGIVGWKQRNYSAERINAFPNTWYEFLKISLAFT